jgi:heme/copper-type cytochrome/quinol oxidase subunit 3
MNATDTALRPAIDVSGLPESPLDHRSTIWWGNLMLLFIETTMFALLIASYFYVRANFQAWPPVQSNWAVARYDTNPSLLWGSLNLGVIVLSFVPILVADRSALRMNTRGAAWGLVLGTVLGLCAIGIRFREFLSLNFRWDDNAYGSMVWTILGLHLTHLIVGSLENLIMISWLAAKGMDAKHARDIRVNAVYWYWIVGFWVLLYAIVYFGPRVL